MIPKIHAQNIKSFKSFIKLAYKVRIVVITFQNKVRKLTKEVN